jgi:pimeloyl-ACP methyl ester carboxylesterase/UDP:flavonoid glycosyltransferase YjiC (YdhE family)
MRASEPLQSGCLTLEGFRISYEVFGNPSASAVLLHPTWQIVHSHIWKMQVPFLARFFRVVTFDAPGNGGGERTTDARAYEYDRIVDQGVELLDHLGIERAHVISFSCACDYGISMAARYPERVNRLILVATEVACNWQLAPGPEFQEQRDTNTYEGWEKYNAHYWREDYDGWLDFFSGELASDPHSTKIADDIVRWGHETTPEILIASVNHPDLKPGMPFDETLDRVRCPVLLIHGTSDRMNDVDTSRTLAALRPDFSYLEIEGVGHSIAQREPVRVNLAIADFLDAPQPTRRTWRHAMARSERRALFVSSPIGLGHIQRDIAIACELRRLIPDLRIDWLAQPPVRQVLEQAGETIHPLSAELASESAHWESHAGGHRLHCFNAFREMDEILLANFMVFLDAASETPYDLWIGDEAWEVDHYLHENPELKTAPYIFMTDFLGWLPIDRSPDSREAFLTADYNAEMLEHVGRFPRVRDRALYFGEYDDLVPEPFGPDLPLIPDWAREHFAAVGYVVPFDPAKYADTRAVRKRLGYDPDRPLVIATVGGTAVGEPLLSKIADAWPLIRAEQPDAECVLVAGPRIDPSAFPDLPGLRVEPYIHNLYEHLAVADLGIVQGGLGTTMELTVNRRPFIYFPLRDHCEQVFHVAHRLDLYGAGQRMDFDQTTPEMLATAALATLGSDTSGYRQHDPGGAARAAREIAALL